MAAGKKKQRVKECMDRISNLPDCIIHLILSFLPTKDAVRTSVLSKKWINMWTFIYNLHFDESQLLFPDKRNKQHFSFTVNRKHFVRFVHRVLLHLSNPTLRSFTLVTLDWYDVYICVDAWIAAALYRQVQYLHIDYKGSVTISSLSLFQCQSLVDLKLMLPGGSLTFSCSYVCLPNLKSLSLSGIKLESTSSPLLISFPSNHQHPIELTLSFPVLRVFKVERFRWHLMNVCLQVPLLEVFSAENVQIFSPTEICTSCPKIFSFLLEDCYYFACENILLSDPSSASIATFQISGIIEFNYALCTLLKRFNKMQCLKLGDVEVKGFLETITYFQDMPKLTNVRELQIGKASIDFLFGLLHNLPILESLILESVSSKSYIEYKMILGVSPPAVPHCVESSLKKVKFGLFEGAEHELYVAEFLLEQGAILEQMFFGLSKTRQNGSSEIETEGIKKKLLSFSMCSSFCVIKFSTI